MFTIYKEDLVLAEINKLKIIEFQENDQIQLI